MAETADQTVQDPVLQFLAQFTNAEEFNKHIEKLFEPLAARIKFESEKSDFKLFSLFLNKSEIESYKKTIDARIKDISDALKSHSTKVKLPKIPNAAPAIKAVKAVETAKPARTDTLLVKTLTRLNSSITALNRARAAVSRATTVKKNASKKTENIIRSKARQEVVISDIDATALKKLTGLGGARQTSDRSGGVSVSKEHTGGLLGKLIMGALAGFAGYTFLKTAWSDDSPLRGVVKTVGTMFTKAMSTLLGSLAKGVSSILTNPVIMKKVVGNGMLKTVAAGVGKLLAKGLKFIPFIGPLVSFGFGIKRMVDGDYAGGIVEALAGLVGLVPGFSFIVPFITDLFLAGYDMADGGMAGHKGNKANTWLASFGRALLETGPIKWLMDIGSSIGDLINGDFKAGITGIIAGLANVASIGPLGWILSALGAKRNEDNGFVTADNVASLGDWLGMFGRALIDTGPIRWLRNIGESIGDILSGDKMQAGLKALSKYLPFSGIGVVAGLFTAPEIEPETENVPKGNIFDKIKAAIAEKFKTVFGWSKGLLAKVSSFFGLDSKDAEPAVNTPPQNTKELDANIQQLKAQEAQETNARRKQQLAKARLKAEAQREKAVSEKVAAQPEMDIDYGSLEQEQAIADTDVVVLPSATIEDEVRKNKTAPQMSTDTDKVVAAINELKRIQIYQAEKTESAQREKKTEAAPVSIINNTRNVKPAMEVNVDTARDSVFITRNSVRQFLYLQRGLV